MAYQHPTRSAEHYQHIADELRDMASKEPEGSSLRTSLLAVAGRYDRLVE
jgi:hypothetical protein